jgi:tetratricopeptide (TPR) repeat protein
LNRNGLFRLSLILAFFALAAAFRLGTENNAKNVSTKTVKGLAILKRTGSISCGVPQALTDLLPDIPPMPGWGSHRWKITTGSDSTQYYFDQGINLYYAFHTLEARASFAKAIRFDSTCAMAWYGKALAMGPTINFGNGYRAENAAFVAANTSKLFQGPCTAQEKGLISAIGMRYSGDTTYNLKKLQKDYTRSMKSLANTFPDNVDIVTLYADALMLEHPWDLYNAELQPKSWTPEIRMVLEKALAIDSLHPGALHFMIHTVEGSLHPEDGEKSAVLLAGLMPDVAHVEHMPSHIYIRSGEYKKGIEVNDKAIRAYTKYLHLYRTVEEDKMLYLTHAVHLKAACAMMAGNFSISVSSCDTLRQLIQSSDLLTPGPYGNFFQYAYHFRLFTLLRFGEWDQILRDSVVDSTARYASFLYHFARGMALSHLSRFQEAEQELDLLKQILQEPELKVSGDPFSSAYDAGRVGVALLTGVLAEQKGQYSLARKAFENAVNAEDALVYNEPRDWPLPARQYLGNLLLKMGDPRDAIAVFQRDLQINPVNGWSLTGLKMAYEILGNQVAIRKLNMDLAIAWQINDRQIVRAVY